MTDLLSRAIVTLYMREGCHLCEEAKDAMLPVLAEFDAELREVDIDDDESLRKLYNEEVPVVFVGEALFARFRADSAKFRTALAKIARAKANGA